MSLTDVLALLGDRASVERRPPFTVSVAEDETTIAVYRLLRRHVFIGEQGLFDEDDLDAHDEDPRTVVLVARDSSGTLLGGVRLAPADPAGADIGWWTGSRLAVDPGKRSAAVGPALVRAACVHAEAAGVLRFDATVQLRAARMFSYLGWEPLGPVAVAGHPHMLMRWPIGRIAALARATKAHLGPMVAGLAGPDGFVGDDGVPVPGSDLVAACDAIIPSMVERDPEWAGWCAVLVNVHDLAAMGAMPVGLLDALGARDASFAARVLSGLRKASAAYGVPILGGHTQLGVPAALSVTALGRCSDGSPVPGGGGQPGHAVRLTVDLSGGWRRGYPGRQWDSTSSRSGDELRAMLGFVAASRPAAAKDVSMAGIAGTLGMLAEASGCGAVLDVASVPRPAGASMGDWLTCFPGFGMLTCDAPCAAEPDAGPAASAGCGELVPGTGVRLRWPDGAETVVIDGPVTGLGPASHRGAGHPTRLSPLPGHARGGPEAGAVTTAAPPGTRRDDSPLADMYEIFGLGTP
jgi:putative N-acetyltransferase (TIGR04045 family)